MFDFQLFESIGLLGNIIYFFAILFFLILFNEAKTHPNHMDSNEI